jgi:hypothetical protein
LNVPGFAEGEDSVHEICKLFESFEVIRPYISEAEDLKILPKVAPPVRDEAHSPDSGLGRKEGQYMAQE